MLKSCPYIRSASDMVSKFRGLCLKDAFSLTKFTGNAVDLHKVVSNDLRKNEMKDKDLNLGTLMTIKHWNDKDHSLGFTIKMNEKPATQRGLLATLRNINDLLSLGTPFLLKGRQIIQTLRKQNLK